MGSVMNNSVRVKVYGKEYNVAGTASRGDIIRCAKYVDDKMELLLGGREHPVTSDIMTLVAMNIAEDYYKVLADRAKALEVIKEKEQEIEGYNRLWDKANDGFKNAKLGFEKAREEIQGLEAECESARKEAARLEEENSLMKEQIKSLKEEIDNLKNANIEMQLYMPLDFENKAIEEEANLESAKNRTKKPVGYNKKKKKNRHKKKSRG